MLAKILLAALILTTTNLVQFTMLESTQDTEADLIATGKAFIELLGKKEFAAAVATFDDTMKTAMPQAKLEEAWNAVQAQVGAFQKIVKTRTEKKDSFTIVVATSEFKNMPIDVKVVLDRSKRVAGLFFTPVTNVEYTPPAYVKREIFSDKEVTVGEGQWQLPGTLSLPVGTGPFPAVVLVHGSGPNDRDESLGPNKPFRDLAWGLASKGIAVLRYEKRTREHAAKLGTIKEFTVKHEVLDDVEAAISLLKKTAGVDRKRIFVVGHSLGGMLVPRIGELDSSLAGLIALAGATRALEDVIPEQYKYIFSLDGTVSAEEQKKLDEAREGRAKVKALTEKDKKLPTPIFGAPASYWLDLRNYDPPKIAHGLKQPLLILQGERDYQVTLQDFGAWKSALGAKEGVTFKSYPSLNHLFIAGTGKSTPAEYDQVGHVDENVIQDIAEWIKSVAK